MADTPCLTWSKIRSIRSETPDRFLECHTLALFSMEKDIFSADLGYLLLFTAAFAAVTAVLIAFGRRKFVK